MTCSPPREECDPAGRLISPTPPSPAPIHPGSSWARPPPACRLTPRPSHSLCGLQGRPAPHPPTGHPHSCGLPAHQPGRGPSARTPQPVRGAQRPLPVIPQPRPLTHKHLRAGPVSCHYALGTRLAGSRSRAEQKEPELRAHGSNPGPGSLCSLTLGRLPHLSGPQLPRW